MQATAVICCCVTAATFLPLRLAGQASVFALIALGHVAMDVAWPQARPLDLRLWTDASIIAFVALEMVLSENLAASQRRGVTLRVDLERALAELKASRHSICPSCGKEGLRWGRG